MKQRKNYSTIWINGKTATITGVDNEIEDIENRKTKQIKCHTNRHSTLTFVRRGSSLARITGELHFDRKIRLIIRERILFNRLPAIIDWYGYEIWHEEEKLYWYDSQPHPNDPDLQSTHPHHKHIPPEIKHNRIPAPEMSFTQPNLANPVLEIEKFLKDKKKTNKKR